MCRYADESMMLRPYQQQAVEAMKGSILHSLNPYVDISTGGGKSLILMALAEWATSFPGKKCLIIAHRKELLEQNAQKTSQDVAIYSAGLGVKDTTSSPIIIAGIQSIHRLKELPVINLLIFDECHWFGEMHVNLVERLLEINPKMRIAGLTATPYNLNPIFNHLAYSIGIKELIDMGYLTPLKSRVSKVQPDLSNVEVRLGDYVTSQLSTAMLEPHILKEAISNILWYGREYYSWLIFCVNVEHTNVVTASLIENGIFAEAITGDTDPVLRADSIRKFKNREIQALVSCEVLITGFDAPNVDMLVMLRPTQSRTLYIQSIGRATRLYEGKDHALILDFANNIETHGPVTNLLPIDRPLKKGERNNYTHRVCPQCESVCEIKATSCEECGYEFPVPKRIINHEGKPADLDIMGDGGKWHTVHYVAYSAHTKKGTQAGEAPPTMRVTYICGTEEFSEWVCVEHPEKSFARRRAIKWLQARNNAMLPSTVQEALQLTYVEPTRIRVVPEGQYKRISAYEF